MEIDMQCISLLEVGVVRYWTWANSKAAANGNSIKTRFLLNLFKTISPISSKIKCLSIKQLTYTSNLTTQGRNLQAKKLLIKLKKSLFEVNR